MSIPSAAFWAAAVIAAVSRVLPVRAASTPLARTAFEPTPVTPTWAALHLPVPSSVTAAATPHTANREAGCGCFTYAAPPCPPVGMRISVSTSSGPSAVVKRSLKKSSTLIVRAPFGPTAFTSAPSASRTAGQSAAGSAWATLPPMVP